MDDDEKKLARRRSARDYLKWIREMEAASPVLKFLSSPASQRFRAIEDLARRMDLLSDYYDPVPSSPQPSGTAGGAEEPPLPTKDAQEQSTQDAGHARHVPGQRWTDEQRQQLLLEVESHPAFDKYRGKKVAEAEVADKWGCSQSLVRQQLSMIRKKLGRSAR